MLDCDALDILNMERGTNDPTEDNFKGKEDVDFL